MAAKIKAVRNRGFRDFSFACRELAALTGNDMKTVIDSEVAAILQDTAANTKVAPVAKIMRDHQKKEWATYDIPYAGSVSGRESYFSAKAAERRAASKVSPKLKFDLRWKKPAWLWSEIRLRRQQSLQRRMERAGLAAKHWYEQAVQLGYDISVNSRVKNAKQRGQLAVRTARRTEDNNYSVEGQNYSELSNRWANGSAALQRAVNKRVRQFQRAMKQWSAGKVHLVAKKYPDLIRVS